MDEISPKNGNSEQQENGHYRNGRKVTKEDFYLFCKIVLEHSNYDEMIKAESQNSPQIADDSMDANGENSLENSSFEESDVNGTYDGDQFPEKNAMPVDGEDNTDSFNSITCYCNKPFAGRPMIECSQCLTWLHMSCAKVKRKNIPEFYYCEKCKAKGITGLSTTSSSSSNDESAGEKSSASSKAITKGTREFKVKQRKLKSNVLGKAKANTMFNRINGQISDKNENFYSPQKKQSAINGKSFKMKKMRKLSQSLQAKSPAKKYMSRPGPAVLASATSRSSTVTSAVNSRIIVADHLVTERNGVDVTLRPSASPINQKSLANNNNHIYHTDLGIDLQPTTNGTETNPDIFSKRTKLS